MALNGQLKDSFPLIFSQCLIEALQEIYNVCLYNQVLQS